MRGQVSTPCRARRLGAPSYRLGGLFRRRKGAGDSVERLPLVFRCRLFGGGRELGTPLFDSAFVAAGSSAAQGDGGYGESLRFSRRGRCPHRAVPGRPGVPPLQRGPKPDSISGTGDLEGRPYGIDRNCPFFRRGRTLAGPQMYAARPGGRALRFSTSHTCSAYSGADAEPQQRQFFQSQGPVARREFRPSLRFCAPEMLLHLSGTRPS